MKHKNKFKFHAGSRYSVEYLFNSFMAILCLHVNWNGQGEGGKLSLVENYLKNV